MWAALLAAALTVPASAQNGAPNPDPAAQTPVQLRRLASAALDQRDPARALELAGRIQPGDKDYGAAQALKARALQQMGDVPGALAAWRRALNDPAQRAAAVANIKLLQGRVGGEGDGGPGAPEGPAASAESYNGLSPRDLSLVASMFRSQDASRTLAATLRKAAQGDASGLADLRRHGIDFARGPAEQAEPVAVRSQDGAQVVTFSPAVLDNPSRSRAVAGLANGVEQAATQRDYAGVSLWLRQWGGRLVGVLVYMQLAPQERPTQSAPEADKRLVADRIAYDSVTASVPSFPKPPMGSMMDIVKAKEQAARDRVQDPAVGFLYFCGQESGQPLSSSSLGGSDEEYYADLRSLPR